MSDLIDREEALTALRDTLKSGGKSKGLRPVTFEMIWAIKSLPSAEPKKGRWTIETTGEIPRYRDSSIYEPIYRCSCCGKPTESYVRFEEPIMPEDADFPRFCPNCGAKMEVEE